MGRFSLDLRSISLPSPSFFHSTRYHFCSWWSILKQKRNTQNETIRITSLWIYVQERVKAFLPCSTVKHKTHTLSTGYCLGCQKHYVDGLARSLLVSTSGVFVSISGSLSMHWTCFQVLRLSDGQAREKSVWYILTATTSSLFLPIQLGFFFPLYFINDTFSDSNAMLQDVECSLKMTNTIFKDVVLYYFMLP